jgi:prepilin-type processing-associated H-X9-DG protein
MKQFALLLGLSVATISQAQDKVDMFGDDKRTFVLMPAEVIASGTVSNVQFSPSGRFVTYTRFENAFYETALANASQGKVPLFPKQTWYRYDRTNKTSKLLPVPSGAQDVVVLGDDRTIYFSGRESTDPQGFVDIGTSAVTKTNFNLADMIYLGQMASAPYFMLKSGETGVELIKPNGQSLTFQTPPKIHVYRPLSSNASSMTFAAMATGEPPKLGHLVYLLSDGSTSFKEITRDEWMKEMEVENQRSEFWYETVGDLDLVKLMNLPKKLVTDLPTRAKLARTGSNPRFGPNNDCVTYEDSGALLIRDIKPMDQAFARKYQAQAAKIKAMSDAKQAALGLIMYAADMDDVLPGGEGWETKVKNSDLLKNFNYTFRGGNMGSIGNPASTELGFMMGPGGRAVAYCDGHVKWVSNP